MQFNSSRPIAKAKPELAPEALASFAGLGMKKTLALRPEGKHPLHVLWEFEAWPLEAVENEGSSVRGSVLSGLPKMQRTSSSWIGAELRSDKVLQEIFHTEERITPGDVPRLCCGLPGIEGCVLARRLEALSAWNMPMELNQETLLQVAAGALDRALEAETAGWGEPQGITLHLEVGNASLLRSGVMQLLLLHEKRGFAPGVREKITMALGALARSLRSGI